MVESKSDGKQMQTGRFEDNLHLLDKSVFCQIIYKNVWGKGS